MPKIPSMRIVDMVRAIAPHARMKNINIRPGEKLHEVLVTTDDSRSTLELADRYVIQPPLEGWKLPEALAAQAKPLPEGFSYSSDTNAEWLSIEDLRCMLS